MLQVICSSIDLHKYFVLVPFPVGMTVRRINMLLPDLVRKQGTKSVPPIAIGFMTNVDTAFMKIGRRYREVKRET